MGITRFTLRILLSSLVWIVGCASPPQPNPVAGWKYCYSDNPIRSNKAVLDDYQEYIQKLPLEERKSIGGITFVEDGTGQHAVGIGVALNGTRWAHVLIYDKENRRTKVIKYVTGKYRC